MQRRTFLIVTGSGCVAACTARKSLPPVLGHQQGIAFDGFRTKPEQEDFDALTALGATHIALFPFGYMRSHTEPTVSRYSGRRVDWSLSDEGLLETGRMAREAGLRVVVLPTLADFRDGHWRGEVHMANEESWARFFESYREFLLHHAALAERMQAVGFSVGTELRETVARTTQWRETIGMVREQFWGWLTYAANWDDYGSIPWWDAVDLIGVQAYFELGDPGNGTVSERREKLASAWGPIRRRLAALSETTGKQILFTEIGYKSHTGSTAQPWKWEIEGLPDSTLQEAAYEAAFDVFWDKPWFAGFYWWKWQTHSGMHADRDFTPQGKPAEQVVRRYYSGKAIPSTPKQGFNEWPR